MTIETARVLAEQVLAKYANLVTLAMREDVARLVLHVEKEAQKPKDAPQKEKK